MAHRLIPLTPPLFFHFTLPLIPKIQRRYRTCAKYVCKYIRRTDERNYVGSKDLRVQYDVRTVLRHVHFCYRLVIDSGYFVITSNVVCESLCLM